MAGHRQKHATAEGSDSSVPSHLRAGLQLEVVLVTNFEFFNLKAVNLALSNASAVGGWVRKAPLLLSRYG